MYKNLKNLIEDNLLAFLPEIDDKSQTLTDAMTYSLLSGGKRIRPVLLLATANFCGFDSNLALPYAIAVEYIHTSSLIHDDLPGLDNDDLRRNKPTNHKVFGEGIAILAGDGLYCAAIEAMSKDILLYFEKPEEMRKRIRALYELIKGSGCRGLLSGQVADLETEVKVCTDDMLRYIHINKTAQLITSSIRAGGWLGMADPDMMQALTSYGESLGLCFQVVDDFIDMDTENTDKVSYSMKFGKDKAVQKINELTEKAVSALDDYENTEFLVSLAKDLKSRTE